MSNDLTILNNISSPIGFHRYVCSFPFLTETEETNLLLDCKTHSRDSLEYHNSAQKLIYYHLRYITKIALRIYDSYQSFKELVAEGVFGLLDAIEHFDLSRKVRFISYAGWWVKARIKEWVHNHNVIKGTNDIVSLSTPITKDDDSFTLEDTIEDPHTSRESIEEHDFNSSCSSLLKEAMATLSDREVQIVTRYNNGESLQDISYTYNISRERVRQINERAYQKIRAYLSTKHINKIEDI